MASLEPSVNDAGSSSVPARPVRYHRFAGTGEAVQLREDGTNASSRIGNAS